MMVEYFGDLILNDMIYVKRWQLCRMILMMIMMICQDHPVEENAHIKESSRQNMVFSNKSGSILPGRIQSTLGWRELPSWSTMPIRNPNWSRSWLRIWPQAWSPWTFLITMKPLKSFGWKKKTYDSIGSPKHVMTKNVLREDSNP